jgi:hypothetical protein
MNTTVFFKNRQFIRLLFLGFFLPLVFISCKKERVAAPISPLGFWNGSAAHLHTAILNKAGGQSRVYFRIFGNDTAGAIIGDGHFTLIGNLFKATYSVNNTSDSIFIVTKINESGTMSGRFYNTNSTDLVDCNLWKQ